MLAVCGFRLVLINAKGVLKISRRIGTSGPPSTHLLDNCLPVAMPCLKESFSPCRQLLREIKAPDLLEASARSCRIGEVGYLRFVVGTVNPYRTGA